jgi:GMP reductase
MKIDDSVKLDFSDVLLRPKRSTLASRKEVDLEREFYFLHSGRKWRGIPIIASNMDTVGTVSMGKALATHGMLTCLHKFVEPYVFQNEIHFVIPSFGIRENDNEQMKRTMELNPFNTFICLDVANGYSQNFLKYVERTRDEWPNHTIIAGNVVTPEMTEALLLAGADVIKIGIGSGACCTTRRVAGVGYPQLSAVMECADAAHGMGGHIIADGGCVYPGDVAKAFGAGADFVMLGGMLAGHDECEGDIMDNDDGTKSMLVYGMSSDTAMRKHYGGVQTHRASEGRTVLVPYRGKVDSTIQEILGGLRSACTYVGARKIKHLPRCATFVRVNRQLNSVFEGREI